MQVFFEIHHHNQFDLLKSWTNKQKRKKEKMASFKILTVFALIAGKVLFTMFLKMDIKMFYRHLFSNIFPSWNVA